MADTDSAFQHTLAGSSTLTGTSLHTGEKVTLTMKPAPAGHGIKFRRIDLEDAPFLDAHVDNVQTVERATTIAVGSVKVHTVEHVTAALTSPPPTPRAVSTGTCRAAAENPAVVMFVVLEPVLVSEVRYVGTTPRQLPSCPAQRPPHRAENATRGSRSPAAGVVALVAATAEAMFFSPVAVRYQRRRPG